MIIPILPLFGGYFIRGDDLNNTYSIDSKQYKINCEFFRVLHLMIFIFFDYGSKGGISGGNIDKNVSYSKKNHKISKIFMKFSHISLNSYICMQFLRFYDELRQNCMFKHSLSDSHYLKKEILELRCCLNNNISYGRSYYYTNISVSDCFFCRSNIFSQDGAVIYVVGEEFSMRIETTTFYHCISSSNGGAIYYDSINLVLKMVCANLCSASSYHFALLKSSQSNSVQFLSISCCSNTSTGQWSTRLSLGKQEYSHSNSSLNKANWISSTLFWTQESIHFSFSTISSNQVSGSVCSYFNTKSGTMLFGNIIQNNFPIKYGVIIADSGSIQFQYSIFDSNLNTLFCVLSGSLELSHCYISHSGKVSTSTPVSTSNNNSFTKQNTYNIQYYESHYCLADDPLRHISSTRSNTLFHQRNIFINLYLTLIGIF